MGRIKTKNEKQTVKGIVSRVEEAIKGTSLCMFCQSPATTNGVFHCDKNYADFGRVKPFVATYGMCKAHLTKSSNEVEAEMVKRFVSGNVHRI